MSDTESSDDNKSEVVSRDLSPITQRALPCPEQAIELAREVEMVDITDEEDDPSPRFNNHQYTQSSSRDNRFPPSSVNRQFTPTAIAGNGNQPSHQAVARQNWPPEVTKSAKEINLLLLGESGVGKSTFINSFANYMKHQNFEAVEENDLTVLIPARFNIFDKDLEKHSVELGTKDNNEYLADEAAATQDVKTYVFFIEIDQAYYKIRLIDTPRMGDPRGIAQDNKNCDYVLNYLGRLDKIHAICLLLKPTNTRLDVFLNYCVTQILSRLEKSATDNIAFLFTNTRGQNYTPGETYTSLELLVKKIKDTNKVHLPLSKDNVFCFDNEAFRFLAATKQGVEFKEGILEANIQSWKYSYKEVYRLLSYIVNLKPHDPKKTVSINHARKMVMQLAQPLAEIVQLIGDNIYELDQHTNQLLMENQTLEQLKKNLHMPVVDIRVKELSQPVTVCTDAKCSTIYKVAGKNKYHYKQRCHNPCYLNNVPAEIVGDPKLLNCAAMNGSQSCNECGCRFNTHMHIYYETETFQNKIVDENVLKNISTKEEATKEKEKLINIVLNKKEALEKEHNYIIKCTASFAHFLQQNAITPINDSLEEYIKYLITREENLGPHAERATLDYLRRLLAEYEQEKKVLEEALTYDPATKGTVGSSLSGIERKIRDLFVLPNFGAKIKKLYDLQQSGGLSEHLQSEHVVQEHYQLSLVQRLTSQTGKFINSVVGKITGRRTKKHVEIPRELEDPELLRQFQAFLQFQYIQGQGNQFFGKGSQSYMFQEQQQRTGRPVEALQGQDNYYFNNRSQWYMFQQQQQQQRTGRPVGALQGQDNYYVDKRSQSHMFQQQQRTGRPVEALGGTEEYSVSTYSQDDNYNPYRMPPSQPVLYGNAKANGHTTPNTMTEFYNDRTKGSKQPKALEYRQSQEPPTKISTDESSSSQAKPGKNNSKSQVGKGNKKTKKNKKNKK